MTKAFLISTVAAFGMSSLATAQVADVEADPIVAETETENSVITETENTEVLSDTEYDAESEIDSDDTDEDETDEDEMDPEG